MNFESRYDGILKQIPDILHFEPNSITELLRNHNLQWFGNFKLSTHLSEIFWVHTMYYMYIYLYNSKAEFLRLCTIGILGQVILTMGDCPVHCRMFSSIPCLYSLDVRVPSSVTTAKNVSKHFQMFSCG